MVVPDESVARPLSLTLASVLCALSGLGFMAVGVGSLMARHGRLSIGVGAILICYGALVLAIGAAGWHRMSIASGGLVASSILHILVLGSSARGDFAWLVWLLVLVPVTIVVCTLMPATRRAFEAD